MQASSESPMHQAIACALVATLALAYITTPDVLKIRYHNSKYVTETML